MRYYLPIGLSHRLEGTLNTSNEKQQFHPSDKRKCFGRVHDTDVAI